MSGFEQGACRPIGRFFAAPRTLEAHHPHQVPIQYTTVF